MKTFIVLLSTVLVLGLLVATSGQTPILAEEVVTETGAAYVEDQVLVFFDLGVEAFDGDPKTFIIDHGMEIIHEFPLPEGFPSPSTQAPDKARAFHLHISDDTEVEVKVSELAKIKGVFASPNYVKYLARIPNDPLFSLQWGLHNTGQRVGGLNCTPDEDIDAPEMWNIRTSCFDVKVAVIDSGAEMTHLDLAGNIGPAPWDFVGEDLNNDNRLSPGEDFNGNGVLDQDNWPEDLDGHGTCVAGIIGAIGNNRLGVTGVCWTADLLIIRMADDCWQANVDRVIFGYLYAFQQKAKVVNASFGGPGFSVVDFLVL